MDWDAVDDWVEYWAVGTAGYGFLSFALLRNLNRFHAVMILASVTGYFIAYSHRQDNKIASLKSEKNLYKALWQKPDFGDDEE